MSEAGIDNNKTDKIIDSLSNVISLDPRFLWFIFLKYKRYLVFIPIILAFIVYIFAKSLPSIFESTASIIIQNDKSNIVKIDEVYDTQKIDQENFINTNLQILKSREIKERIINNPKYEEIIMGIILQNNETTKLEEILITLGLHEKKKINYENIVNEALKKLNISSSRNSSVIKLTLEHKNPDIAYNLLAFIIESYLQFDIDQKIEITSYANLKIKDRLEELKSNLTAAEENLQKFKNDKKLIDLGDIKNLKSDEIKSISNRILKAEQEIQSLQNNLQQIKISQDDLDELIALKVLRDNDEISSIKSEFDSSKSNLDSLLLVYTKNHPKVEKANKSHNLINDKLKNIIDENITVYAYELSNLESFVKLSNLELESARKELQDLEIMDLEMQKYVREVNLNEKLYQTFMERLKETNEVKELQVSDAKILDQPSYSLIPIFPKPIQSSFITIILTMLSLFFIASYYEIFKRAITNSDVLEANNFDVLGVVPKIKAEDSVMNKAVAYLQKKHQDFIESIKSIEVVLIHKFQDSKVFLVTSPLAQEGKTTFSMNLALSLAQKHKTLYLELDLRRPSLGKTFDVSKHLGFTDLFYAKGDLTFSDIVLNMEGSSLDIITAGKPNNNFNFNDKKIKDFISALKEIYDYIIIDSAPILPISDTLSLAVIADEILLVARSEQTKISGLTNAKKKLKNTTNININCVINFFDTDKLDYYNYYNYGKYTSPYYNYS